MWNFVAFCYRIFQFENFARTKKRVLAREPQGGALVGGRGIDVYEFSASNIFAWSLQPGWYVSVHIGSVPRSFAGKCDRMVLFLCAASY